MALHLVRHGRTEANAAGLLLGRADPNLDPTGRDQARSVAGALPTARAIISSPLARCRQTAELIAEEAGCHDLRFDERLLELDYGQFDLTPVVEIPADIWHRWRTDPHFRPPDGETLAELSARVSAFLDETAPLASDDEFVVVSHVSPIKAAVAWALGVDIAISWRCFVAQASISRIGWSSRGPSLQLFNSTEHLIS